MLFSHFLYYFIIIFTNIGSYIAIARNASSWLTNYGSKDMFVFKFGNLFLDSILNIIPLTFFSITSSSSSKIIFLVLNFISFRLIWNISNFGFKYKKEALVIFLLYILPYTITIINSGGALRVLLTGVFSSAIIINQKYINILNKRKSIIASN